MDRMGYGSTVKGVALILVTICAILALGTVMGPTGALADRAFCWVRKAVLLGEEFHVTVRRIRGLEFG